jgi:hypothetical protein
MSKKVSKQERDEAIARLKTWLKPGDTIFTCIRSVSRSGMYRTMAVYHFATTMQDVCWGSSSDRKHKCRREVQVECLTYNVALACGYRFDRQREALGVGGCGMDMGFAVVYDLSMKLFGNGYDLNQRWL